MSKWSAVIASTNDNNDGKTYKSGCAMHIDGLKNALDMLKYSGVNFNYKNYTRERDLYEMIFNLVSTNNIVMLYANMSDTDKFCQVYLPENISEAQIESFKNCYQDLIKDVKVYLSGIDEECFKDTEIIDENQFDIDNYAKKEKSR